MSLGLLALAVVMSAKACAQELPATTDAWIEAVDRAFALKPDAMLPGVMFFPAVGADSRIRNDGAAIGEMAAYATTYMPRRRLEFTPALGTRVWQDAGITQPDTHLDQKTIDLCCKALGLKRYVVPRLESAGGTKLKLTVDFHGTGEHPSKAFTHEVDEGDLPRVPGMIAKSVLEHMGAKLSPEEWRVVSQPQVQTAGNVVDLNKWLCGLEDFGEGEKRVHAFLELNPTCVSAWNRYLAASKHPDEAITRFNKVRPRPPSQRLRIIATRALREVGRAKEALSMLLELAPSHRTDLYYQRQLVECAQVMGEERLTHHLLMSWAKLDTSYIAREIRGDMLVDWAWDARGSGWANTVTENGWRDFRARLQAARVELEDAVKDFPEGWVAHARLETVAMGLGLARAYLEEHFEKAVKVRPRYYQAYSAKHQYLMPRWHGSSRELIAFGKQCLDTGYWKEGIPQLQLDALRDSTVQTGTAANIYRRFEDPQTWAMVSDYYKQAQRHGDVEDRRQALHYYARCGVMGKHYEDVVVPFQKLYRPGYFIPVAFPEFLFFNKVMHARTGRLGQNSFGRHDRALCLAQIALGEGDLESAEKNLALIEEPKIHQDAIAACTQAIRIGRILRREKRYNLTAQELKVTSTQALWRVDGDRLLCELFDGYDEELKFPLGIKHGIVRGTLEWSGNAKWVTVEAHTDALRDRVCLVINPKQNQVRLERVRTWVETGELKPGVQHFQLEYGAETDRLSLEGGAQFETPVHEDIPSGFAIRFFADRSVPRPDGKTAFLTLRDVSIEVKD
jgi:hypothetical protein